MAFYPQWVSNTINLRAISSRYPTSWYLQTCALFHLHRWCKHHRNVSTEPKQTLRGWGHASQAEPYWITVLLLLLCWSHACLILYNRRVFLSLNKSQCSIKQTSTLRLTYSFILRLSYQKRVFKTKNNSKIPNSPTYLTLWLYKNKACINLNFR